jgi:hypothetical protein
MGARKGAFLLQGQEECMSQEDATDVLAVVNRWYQHDLDVVQVGDRGLLVRPGSANWFIDGVFHKGFWLTEDMLFEHVPNGSSRVVARIDYDAQNIRLQLVQRLRKRDLLLAGVRCEGGVIVQVWDARRYS